MGRTRESPAAEHRSAVLVGLLLLGLTTVAASCSETARYRVLTFLFDGVPRPGEKPPPPGYGPLDDGLKTRFLAEASEKPSEPLQMFPHEPYGQGKCGSCHNQQTGQLFSTPAEGLCRSCHVNVPGRVRYVHGPVAVDACTFCHHQHASPRPYLLLDEPTALCLRCHQRDDLIAGPHHQSLDERACTECHAPHGGSDRFFLKSDER